MIRFIRAAAAVAALSASASIAEAQGPVSFGIAGGISMPTGKAFDGDSESESVDNSDILKNGFHGMIVLGFKAPLVPFGLRGELMYTKFPGNELDAGPIFGTVQIPDVSIISAHVNGLFELPLPIAKPYLIGGVGMYSTKADEDAGGFFEGDSDRENDFGVNIGVGTKFQLTGLSTFVEVRYHVLFTGEDETADSPETKNFKFIPVTFGIMF